MCAIVREWVAVIHFALKGILKQASVDPEGFCGISITSIK